MNRLWRRMPAGALAKTRLAAFLLACFSMLGQAGQVGNGTHTATWNTAAAALIVLIVGALIVLYRRRRAGWWDALLLPPLIALGGSGLTDPVTTTGLSIAVLALLSLYGSTATWVVRSLGGIVAVPVAVALSPLAGDRPMAWNSPTVVGILPQLVMMCAMMRGIYAALRRQERASGREAVLARTGSRILAATDIPTVRAIGDDAADALVALSPGVALLIVQRGQEGVRVKRVVGLPEELVGAPVDEAVLADGAPSLPTGDVRHWHGVALTTGRVDRYLLVGGRKAVPTDVVDAFSTLGHQIALGEATCRSHAELLHRAHHDHLTTLPNRALLADELVAAVAGGGPVALLNIDLDDFKQVNDGYGHAAGDDLLVQVAARLSEVAGADGVAARFGGDEFAVLLTGVADPACVDQIAEGLCRRVIEPIRLAGGTVTVGASIGIAVAGPGLTAAELLRHADIAMYSAKAKGKNRVERFTDDRHGALDRHRLLEERLGRTTTLAARP